MTIIDALTRFDGRIDATTFWICQAILMGATLVVVTALTRGRIRQDDYGVGTCDNNEYFWIVVATNAMIAYPTLAVLANRLNAIGWSVNWAWAFIGIIVAHALAQKLGLNGSARQPTLLCHGMCIIYILGLIVLGT